MTIEYRTACQAWNSDEDVVALQNEDGDLIGQIPLPFLTGCDQTQTVSYLQYVIQELLCLESSSEVVLTRNDTDHPIAPDELAQIGVYTFFSGSTNRPRQRIGPQGKSLSRPFRDTDGTSTVSKSSRSSINQNKFRERLLTRDGRCLVTDIEEPDNLVAAHVVPFSLGQSYLDGLTNYPRQVTLYSVTGGILLRPDLHQAFDRYRWGIYVNTDKRQFIHIFDGSEYLEYHGKEILYRVRNRGSLPNLALLRWQYQQCLMARIRGYYM